MAGRARKSQKFIKSNSNSSSSSRCRCRSRRSRNQQTNEGRTTPPASRPTDRPSEQASKQTRTHTQANERTYVRTSEQARQARNDDGGDEVRQWCLSIGLIFIVLFFSSFFANSVVLCSGAVVLSSRLNTALIARSLAHHTDTPTRTHTDALSHVATHSLGSVIVVALALIRSRSLSLSK